MKELDCAIQRSKIIISKYKELLPNTIYFDGWVTSNVAYPSKTTLTHLYDHYRSSKGKSDYKVAEIGIGGGVTSCAIAEIIKEAGELHLFDFHESVIKIKKILNLEGYENIVPHGNSFKLQDSYNFGLLDIIRTNGPGYFDYIYLDGAHTFPVDALAFFLCDILLKPGGLIDFDDYGWTIGGHIKSWKEKYDPKRSIYDGVGSFCSFMEASFTEKQLEEKHVALIVDDLVKKTGRYEEIKENRIFKKRF